MRHSGAQQSARGLVAQCTVMQESAVGSSKEIPNIARLELQLQQTAGLLSMAFEAPPPVANNLSALRGTICFGGGCLGAQDGYKERDARAAMSPHKASMGASKRGFKDSLSFKALYMAGNAFRRASPVFFSASRGRICGYSREVRLHALYLTLLFVLRA